MMETYNITPEEYDDYAGHYFNVIEEIKAEKADRACSKWSHC